jgi:anthranilate synthase component 2
MILILDNYDSFTYNLFQYVGTLDPDIKVVRNDKITVEEVGSLSPSHIIISPGPGYPLDAGISIPLIRSMAGKIPVLGVCLGHQAVGEAFGGNIIHAPQLMHGKADKISICSESPIFQGLPSKIEVGRYHSLAVSRENLPDTLDEIAVSKDGCIMALAHRELPVYGIQFHPESVLTPDGMKIIQNFLQIGEQQ